LGAVWSPDGSRIASWSPGNECGYPQGHVAPRLWISSVAGSGSVELPPLLDAGARPGRNNSGGAVAWSGDGRKLLYSIDQYLGGGECRLQNPPSLLYTIDATGRNRHKVVDHGGSSGTIFDAVWAPDGQAVAFLALDGVYMKPLTGELRLVFPLANVNLGDPYGLTWLQPQELVFTSPGALRIADPQSTSQRVLMRARYLQLVASSAESQEVAVADANDTVTVISLDGKKRWRIPRSPGRVPHAALSGVTIYLR
jgi:Tol biopolymer transport system component